MPQRPDDTHPLLQAWARWHAAQGMTGCSSLARVIERSRVGLSSGAGTVRRRVRVETDTGTRYETRDVWQAPQRDTRSTSRSAPPLGVEAPSDVLRVADSIAIHPEHGILAIQATSASNVAARVRKITTSDSLILVRKCGIAVQVWGWRADRDTPRVEDLS